MNDRFLLFVLLLFGVNNIYAQSGNVGIGIANPDAKLHIVGDVKIVDGTQGEGKILTSDATGLVKWTDAVPSTSEPIPLNYQGGLIYAFPSDSGVSINSDDANSICNNLMAFGFSDWYLPSRLELNALYKQSYLLTGLNETESIKYWSSTDKDEKHAYTQRLDYGGPDPDLKNDTVNHNCRCIRK